MPCRRLVLHAGLPKTGTSALQELLYETRSSLINAGALYPDWVVSPQKPQHRFLIAELRRSPSMPRTKAVLSEAEARGINHVILSTEGLTGHITAIRKECAATFNKLTQDWDVEIIVVTRDELNWRRSLYRQCIISPRLDNSKSTLEQAYATSLSYIDFAKLETIKDLPSESRIAAQFRGYFPNATVTFLRYEDNFIDRFAVRCGIDQIISAQDAPRSNTMPDDCYIEIIRQMNAISKSQTSNILLRAAVAIKTRTSNLHLLGYINELARGSEIFKAGLVLYVQLSRLRYQDNPPLITHAGSFALARRAIRSQILAITLRQTFTAWFR